MPNFASVIQKAIDVASIEGFGQNVTIRTNTAGSYKQQQALFLNRTAMQL